MPSRENRPVLYATIAFLIVSGIILVLSIVFSPEVRDNQPAEPINIEVPSDQAEGEEAPPVENNTQGVPEIPLP